MLDYLRCWKDSYFIFSFLVEHQLTEFVAGVSFGRLTYLWEGMMVRNYVNSAYSLYQAPLISIVKIVEFHWLLWHSLVGEWTPCNGLLIFLYLIVCLWFRWIWRLRPIQLDVLKFLFVFPFFRIALFRLLTCRVLIVAVVDEANKDEQNKNSKCDEPYYGPHT